MGTVFLARRPVGAADGDESDGLVAVKILNASLQLSPAAQRRFAREQAIAARLRHPGICSVIETGDADGVPFIVMEYVEGQGLSERIASSLRAGQRPDGEEVGKIHLAGEPANVDAAEAHSLLDPQDVSVQMQQIAQPLA